MADVQYVFRATGANEVLQTFKKIGDAADDAGEKVAAAVGGGGKRAGSPATAARREQQQRIRAIEREAQQRRARIKRADDRELRDLQAKLAKEAAMEKCALEARERAHEAHQRKLAAAQDRVRQGRREFLGRAGSFAMSGGLMAGAVLGGMGVMATRAAAQNRDSAIRLAIQGGGDADAVRKSAERTALATPGATTEGILGAKSAFVTKTGDLEAAERFQRTIAEISVASSADITSVAEAAADLYEKFDVKSMADMEDALAALVKQGKEGAFELKDAADQFPKLAAAAQRLGIGKGVESVKVLGGLTQIARSATGSPEQAATALEATFRQLTAKAPELKRKHGVHVFDEKGDARDVRQVLAATIESVGGTNIEKKKVGLQQIFGEEGIRAISPLITEFAEATQRGENGFDALMEMMNDAIDAGGAYAEVQRDLAAAQQQTSVKLAAAWDNVVSQVGGRLEPALVAFADTLNSSEFQGALGLAGDRVGEFASAVDAAIDALEDLPLVGQAIEEAREELKQRALGKTPEERVQKARERLEERQRARSGILRGLDPEAGPATLKAQAEQLNKLFAADAADYMIMSANEPAAARHKAERSADVTPDQFASQWVEAEKADNWLVGHNGIARDLAAKEAKVIAGRIAGGEEHAVPWWMDAPNDTQKRLIESMQGSVATARDGGASGAVPTDEVVSGLGALASALAASAEASIQQASAAKKAAGEMGKVEVGNRTSAFQD